MPFFFAVLVVEGRRITFGNYWFPSGVRKVPFGNWAITEVRVKFPFRVYGFLWGIRQLSVGNPENPEEKANSPMVDAEVPFGFRAFRDRKCQLLD